MMKTINYYFILLFCLAGVSLKAQMPNGLDTLYGNEWIEDGQAYLRIPISEDGFYRINRASIAAQGWPVSAIPATDYQLFHDGKPVYLYTSNVSGTPLGTDDFLVFYGESNKGELDQYLYRNPAEQQLNPNYSLIADEAAYYLTYQPGADGQYTSINNDLSSLPPAALFVWQEVEQVYSEHFMKEYYRVSGSTLHYSHFSIGEGFGSRSINQLLADGSTVQTALLSLENAYAAGPNPIIETRYTAALFDHIQRLSVNETTIRTDTFIDWKLLNITETLPVNILSEGEARVQWEGFGGEKDEVSVGFVKITYPAQTNAGGSSFYKAVLPANGQSQYLEINNWGAAAAVVYDMSNHWRIPVNNIQNGLLRISLPASTEDRQLMVIEGENELPSVDLFPVNLNLPNTNHANYIILTNSLLRADGDPVQAYADYRASMAGGGYRTAVVNVDDLYDQFAYGIQQHPLGIRNFVAWQRKINPDFHYLFIVGKGREYRDLRTPAALEEALDSTLFVASFGYPASDNLLVSGMHLPTPLVSIGRLPAINSTEVALYLNKIQSKEALSMNEQTIEARAWMKDIVHLGGGTTPSEKQGIKNNLNNMARELEQGKFGARTTSFFKASSDPIQTSVSDQIFDRINKGVSLITFFGHSSAGTFDFNIDNPSRWENAPKYPLLLSLGCYSGNMFSGSRSIGERFIFLEEGGAGAYGASRGLGFIQSLNDLARYFYQQMSNDYYGLPIGDGLRISIQNFENRTDNAYGTLMEQFSLQGDPAFRLNPLPGPDFVFDAQQTRFEPSIINAQKDSFEVILTLQNIGRAVTDSIDVQISRVLPSSESATIIKRVASPAYTDELHIRLPTEGLKGVGVNKLLATINASSNNPVAESPMPQAGANNELLDLNGNSEGVPFFIIDNTALPVWPPEYALVGDSDIELKASTADALAPERKYFMQLDTTPDFEQPLAITTIEQKGGVLSWQPDFNWQDNTVYYWRVTPDSLSIGTPYYVWESSSFTYIENVRTGWGQGHWGQYAENDLHPLEVAPGKQLDFVVDVTDLSIKNIIYTVGTTTSTRPDGFVNGRRWSDFFRWNIQPSLQIVVVDTLGVFWRNHNPGEYGSVNTSTQVPIACFSFPLQTTEQRANIINFLTNVVPDNHTVIVYNAIRNPNQDLWINDWAADSLSLDGQNIFNVLEAEGALKVRSLLEGAMRPYLFSYVKGQLVLEERITDEPDEFFVYNLGLPGRWTEGAMSSKEIGPAVKWDELSWYTPPQSENDTLRIKLYGLSDTGGETLLVDSIAMEGQVDLSTYSASDFPRMKLNFYAEDRIDKSCAPLDFWHVYYQEVPDLAIDGNIEYAFYNDTIKQGEDLQLRLAVSNISESAIDSTKAVFRLQTEEGTVQETWEENIPALLAGENHIITTNKNTAPFSGLAQLQLIVNPLNAPEERWRINNQIIKEFNIEGEKITPVIDVTFDGQKILNGDLVSARPFVTIKIKDENPYLLLKDSSMITLTLQDRTYGTERTIQLDGTEAQFYPALSTDNNEATIEWQPDFINMDSIEVSDYTLRIRGRDHVGNEARLLYELDFKVIEEQMLSNVLPYPNPFSTSTRFVYTLTGIDSPSQYKIQIMTLSGRIVREIDQTELGPLQIGTHITDFVWDGTDMYGDKLAVGTYLYRVIALNNEGSNLENYDNGTNAFFKNKLGKIVILR